MFSISQAAGTISPARTPPHSRNAHPYFLFKIRNLRKKICKSNSEGVEMSRVTQKCELFGFSNTDLLHASFEFPIYAIFIP